MFNPLRSLYPSPFTKGFAGEGQRKKSKVDHVVVGEVCCEKHHDNADVTVVLHYFLFGHERLARV